MFFKVKFPAMLKTVLIPLFTTFNFADAYRIMLFQSLWLRTAADAVKMRMMRRFSFSALIVSIHHIYDCLDFSYIGCDFNDRFFQMVMRGFQPWLKGSQMLRQIRANLL